MSNHCKFFIDGEWVEPHSSARADVIDPSTEQVIATIALGDATDVDAAVSAAKRAFIEYSNTTVEDRLALFDRILYEYEQRADEMAEAITQEMGAPTWFARKRQVPAGLTHFKTARDVLRTYSFEAVVGETRVVKEPVGVCGLITPWNWPLNQIACKVAPALAAGCTMVLKPSEVAPLDALILAEVLHAAGVPAGVFNLVNGDGAGAGMALASHPDVDMISFTGSTRAGIEVARAAAPTVKRVAQELGGKSPNIVLDDSDLETVVRRDFIFMCGNSGQSCNAPTRLLVPHEWMDRAGEIAAATASEMTVGDPNVKGVSLGPVVSKVQFERIQALIDQGLAEGATLVAGGAGRPDGIDVGYFVKPTVFSHVTNEMTIAREEVFGPVMVIIGYGDEDEAVAIANDTPYGLAAYVSGEPDRALAIASRLRAGQVVMNGAFPDFRAPFGGFKQSGNGREWGQYGLDEYLEVKALLQPAR